ncbi:MAG: hypothetical protein GWO28_05470 [candidate division Zixibacteria bacterium]|nr:hypothetical protein [candidate division Zixibacteria bacterium]
MAIFEGESYSEEEFERDYMIVSPIQDGSICDACWREWQRQMRENE